jgi:chromosome segregation ATPase
MNPSFVSKGNSASIYVQANSVQSQFSALTKDRETFRIQKEGAEKETKKAQERLLLLKAEQLSLMQKIQESQESLGDRSRKREMMKDEMARLKRVIECERKALVDCANHTAKLVKQEQEATKGYVNELGTLNHEIADILEQKIIDSIMPHVSVESLVQVLRGNNFPNKQVLEEKFIQIKRLEQLLNEETERYKQVKADYDKIEHTLVEHNTNETISPHMDIFYGPEVSPQNEKET